MTWMAKERRPCPSGGSAHERIRDPQAWSLLLETSGPKSKPRTEALRTSDAQFEAARSATTSSPLPSYGVATGGACHKTSLLLGPTKRTVAFCANRGGAISTASIISRNGDFKSSDVGKSTIWWSGTDDVVAIARGRSSKPADWNAESLARLAKETGSDRFPTESSVENRIGSKTCPGRRARAFGRRRFPPPRRTAGHFRGPFRN